MAKTAAKAKLTPILPPERPMFVTWEDAKGKALALRAASQGLARSEPIVRNAGSNIFLDIAPGNISVKDNYSRRDYDEFRREDALPVKPKAVVAASMDAYDKIGIVRNVVDLMADFATQGISLNHPNERIEKWYKEWWRKIRGKERSERFTNLLYRTANVIVKRHTAKLSISQEEQMKRTQSADMEIPAPPKVLIREIPWKYTFYNPLSIEVMADELSVFVGQDDLTFAIKVPRSLVSKVQQPKGVTEKALVKRLPRDVVEAIKRGDTVIPLDPEKVKGFYYKRDDWKTWASPMVSAILADLQLLQKMKLADLSALDGAISCIRVWKLGDLEAKIMPTEVAIARLSEMLCNNVGGGVMDLVWDAALSLQETSTEVHRFLGSTKYEPVLTSIYAGLGIPPTLTGAGTGGGFTNNFISLKTLTERLQYGRDILTAFWEEEIRIVQKAMGFRFPATIVFDRMTLSDEAAEKQLLINLADRDLISWESIVERFDENPEIEQVRMRREDRKRQNGQLPPKAGPFHTNQDFEMKKTFAGQGLVAPSQVGLDLPAKKEGDKSLLDVQNQQAVKQTKLDQAGTQQQNDHQFRTEKLQLKHGVHPLQQPAGQPGQGRPKNAKDSSKRKQKRVLPRSSAVFFQTMAWAENAQATINQTAKVGYLRSLGKQTLKELTDDETKIFERYKFYVLCQLEPNQALDDAAVATAMTKDLGIPSIVDELLKSTVAKHVEINGKEPTLDVLRRFQAGTFAFWKGEYDEDEDEDEEETATE